MSSRECLSCCDQFADTELISAEVTRAQLGGSGDSRRGAGCSGDVACAHRFCRACLLSYVSGALRHGTFPVPCPMGPATCGNVFDRSTLVALLGKDSGELLQVGASRLVLQGFRTACPRSPSLALIDCAGRGVAHQQPSLVIACQRTRHCIGFSFDPVLSFTVPGPPSTAAQPPHAVHARTRRSCIGLRRRPASTLGCASTARTRTAPRHCCSLTTAVTRSPSGTR